jgi:hypothetical protein
MTYDTPRSTKPSVRGYDNAKPAGGWLRSAMADPNLFIIIAFCAIGLLVTLNLMFRFPDFGMAVEQFSQLLG